MSEHVWCNWGDWFCMPTISYTHISASNLELTHLCCSVALSLHSKTDLILIKSACSPCACLSYLQVLRLQTAVIVSVFGRMMGILHVFTLSFEQHTHLESEVLWWRVKQHFFRPKRHFFYNIYKKNGKKGACCIKNRIQSLHCQAPRGNISFYFAQAMFQSHTERNMAQESCFPIKMKQQLAEKTN